MRIYEFNGKRFQFVEGTQPAGAVEVKPDAAVKTKQSRPARTKTGK